MKFEISLITFFVCIAIASLLSKARVFSFLNNRESRFETIDGLRGFLAISVFLHHFVITYYWKVSGAWVSPPENYYQNYGKVGVAIFFMITGFLFISKLLNTERSVNWFKIYESRIFRIMPIYVFAVASILIIVFHNSDYQLISSPFEILKQIIRWAAFYGGTINEFRDTRTIIAGVDWTLKYEWAFYIALPVIFVIIKRTGLIANCVLFSLILVLFKYPVNFLSFNSSYGILFMVGGLTAYLVNLKLDVDDKIDLKVTSTLTSLLLISIIFYPKTLDFIHVILMSMFFILVVLGNSIFGLLRLKSAKLLGEISYSIYLLHGLVLYIVFTQFAVLDFTKLGLYEYSIFMPIIGSIVVLISSITFLCIEKPFIEYGRQYKVTSLIAGISEQANKALQRASR